MNTNFYGYAPFLQQLPAPRSEILCLANGGFIARDGSGTPIIQANGEPQRVNDDVWVFAGDASGRNFTNWSQPFLKRGGYWGCLHLNAADPLSNSIFALATSQYFSGTQSYVGLEFIKGQILRRLEALFETPLVDGVPDSTARLDSGALISGLDGYQCASGTWPEGTGLRLNGTPSTSRLRLCTTWDATNLYVSAQVQTTNIRSADGFTIRLDPQNSSSRSLVSGILEIKWQPNDTLSVRRYNGLWWTTVSSSAWTRAARINGTRDNTADTDTGYSLELAIPWSAVGSHQSTLGLYCEFRDAQLPSEFSGSRPIEGSSASSPVTWIPLALLSPAPAIVTPPRSQEVLTGDDVTFTLSATGASPLAYQWFFAGSPLPGRTNSTLQLLSVTTNQAGGYYCIVTNSLGGATSAVATLSLNVQGVLRNGGFEHDAVENTIPAAWNPITNSYGSYGGMHYSGDFCMHAGIIGVHGGETRTLPPAPAKLTNSASGPRLFSSGRDRQSAGRHSGARQLKPFAEQQRRIRQPDVCCRFGLNLLQPSLHRHHRHHPCQLLEHRAQRGEC